MDEVIIRMRTRLFAAPFILVAAILAPVAPARAQSPSPAPDRPSAVDPERLQRLLADLAESDHRVSTGARDEMISLGSEIAPRVIERIAETADGPPRDRLVEVLEAIVEGWILDLQKILSPEETPVPAVAGLGGLTGLGGTLPRGSGDIAAAGEDARHDREAAEAARASLLAAGLPIARFLVVVPPLRDREVAFELRRVGGEIYAARVEAITEANDAERTRLHRRAVALADLGAPVIRGGVADERPEIAAFYQAVAAEALEAAFAGLTGDDPRARTRATERIYVLGELAKERLEELAAGDDPDLRFRAERLLRRIHFRITDDLYDRIGHTLEGYEERGFRERRTACLELERLGGEEAVPTLRRIVNLETSRAVRIFAAKSLLRIGDWLGRDVLIREGLRGRLDQDAELLVAIHMDQGIKFLQIGKYELAIREFQNILKVQPKNDTALYNMACAYSLWGKIEEALDYLEKSVEHGFDDAEHMERDPDLDNLRGEARYLEIIEDLKARQGNDE